MTDSPDDIYGKTLSIPDNLIEKYFKLAADLPDNEIKVIKKSLKDGSGNPRDIKRHLARKIVAIYHSEEDAFAAQERFDHIFISKGAPEDMPEINLTETKGLLDVLLENELIESKSAGRRLIKQNAIKIDDNPVSDETLMVNPGTEMVIKVGKRRFLKIIK